MRPSRMRRRTTDAWTRTKKRVDDQDETLARRGNAGREFGSQVTPSAHRQLDAPRRPEEVRSEMTVVENKAGIGVEAAKCVVVVKANEMIDVRRDHIAESP